MERISQPADGLLRPLFERLSQLLRKEVELVRAEARVDARRGLWASALGSVAVMAAVGALGCALLALVSALGKVMPFWAGALGAAILLAAVSATFAAAALSKGRRARPERSLREARATMHLLSIEKGPP